VILRRYIAVVVIPLLTICSILFALMLFQRLSSISVWDDAYFFVRYADNLLNSGQITWNPNDTPTYGLTSLAYLIVVIPLRLLFPTQPAVVMLLASLICGALAFIAMIRLCFVILPNKIHVALSIVLVSISSVVAGEHITTHLTSGMDTMFALLMLTLWLLLLYSSERYILIGIFGGLFLWIRPDILLIVASMIILRFSHSQFRKLLFSFLAMLVFILLENMLYFGDIFPLPFYAKSTDLYGAAFYNYYTNTSQQFLFDFISSYPYFVLLAFASCIFIVLKKEYQGMGLVIGLLGFTLYQLYFVVPVMGFSQRFYYPLLPILILLSLKVIPLLLKRLSINIVEVIQFYPHKKLFVPVLLLFVFVNPLPIVTTFVNFIKPSEIPVNSIGRFDLQTSYDALYTDIWYKLDTLSTLNDNIVIATTEIGLPGVMNPRKTIIDLAGLNDPQMAHNGFSAEYLLVDIQPDWLYMPFPHYEAMWYSIFNDAKFQEHYHYIPAQALGTAMDVAILRSSPHYRDMLEIVNQYE